MYIWLLQPKKLSVTFMKFKKWKHEDQRWRPRWNHMLDVSFQKQPELFIFRLFIATK